MDFHCHLDLYPNAREVYREASRRNEFTWLVTTSPKAFHTTCRALQESPNILITPGLHPEIVHERAGEVGLLLEQMRSVKAVGEVGLDGAARYRASYGLQRDVFSAVLARCQELGGRTLSIHSRRAVKDVLVELDRRAGFGIAVLHWFTGNAAELRAAEEQGCWFSIGPAMFESNSGRATAARLPRDRIVPESDGPFAKVDGKPVLPWSGELTARLLAKAWQVPETEAVQILDENSRRLLGLMNASQVTG